MITPKRLRTYYNDGDESLIGFINADSSFISSDVYVENHELYDSVPYSLTRGNSRLVTYVGVGRYKGISMIGKKERELSHFSIYTLGEFKFSERDASEATPKVEVFILEYLNYYSPSDSHTNRYVTSTSPATNVNMFMKRSNKAEALPYAMLFMGDRVAVIEAEKGKYDIAAEVVPYAHYPYNDNGEEKKVYVQELESILDKNRHYYIIEGRMIVVDKNHPIIDGNGRAYQQELENTVKRLGIDPYIYKEKTKYLW